MDCMYVLRCDVSCCVGEGVGVEVEVVVVVVDDVEVVELMCWSAILAYRGRLGRVARRL